MELPERQRPTHCFYQDCKLDVREYWSLVLEEYSERVSNSLIELAECEISSTPESAQHVDPRFALPSEAITTTNWDERFDANEDETFLSLIIEGDEFFEAQVPQSDYRKTSLFAGARVACFGIRTRDDVRRAFSCNLIFGHPVGILTSTLPAAEVDVSTISGACVEAYDGDGYILALRRLRIINEDRQAEN